MKTINKNTEIFDKNISHTNKKPLISLIRGEQKGSQNLNYPPLKMRIKGISGFTLVELIIVITILAILATIAFMSFQGYTKEARDGNRLATLNSIQKGLDVYAIKNGKYPKPNGTLSTGTLNGTGIILLGDIGQEIGNIIKINTLPMDPISGAKYVYATNINQTHYQIGASLEEWVAKVVGNYSGLFKQDNTVYPTQFSFVFL